MQVNGKANCAGRDHFRQNGWPVPACIVVTGRHAATAQDLLKFGIIDGIVPEPLGGAHRNPDAAIAATGVAIAGALEQMGNMSRDQVRDARAAKFLGIGRRA